MTIVGEKVVYQAFGFSLSSEIPLPELPRAEEQGCSMDIEIQIGDIPGKYLTDPSELMIHEKMVIFKVPGTAVFSVQDGNRIIVSPLKEYDEDLVRLYLLGSCMGVILMQRKIFPLHGSAIAIKGKAYAIIGDSGAGKSTLASAFLRSGCQLLSDDIIPLDFSKEKDVPFVVPSYPQQKLWQESLAAFGEEADQYRSIHGRETKFCVPVASQFSAEMLPLAGIFELSKTENDKIEVSKIESLEGFPALYHHTYRHFLIQRLGLMEWHFHTSATILKAVPIFRVCRPISRFSVQELKEILLNIIDKEIQNESKK